MEIDSKTIDSIRKKGFRPGVVGVFIKNKKALLLYKKDFDLWLFPQGGIDNNETLYEALTREIKEEIGDYFVNTWESKPTLIFEDRIKFRKSLHNNRKLNLNDGTKINMLGKHYYYMTTKTNVQNIKIDQSEFDNYRWVTYKEALKISENIYQKNKKKALIKVLKLLVNNNTIK